MRVRRSISVPLLVGLAALAFLGPACMLFATSSSDPVVMRFTSQGELVLPDRYREWVFVGSSLTPREGGEGASGVFHVAYIHRAAFAHHRKTGSFPDGTILVRERVGVGAREAPSGKGFFMGEFLGLEAAVKSRKRFPTEPGNWGYFSFGHRSLADMAKPFRTASCNTCHEERAQDDFVFTQYHPVLREARVRGGGASGQASFTPAGELIRPGGHREWIHVGTSLAPDEGGEGEAPSGVFHAVYIHPEAYAHFRATGEFPNGTIVVRELASARRQASSIGTRYLMGGSLGLEVAVKSRSRFPDAPGSWAYFRFDAEGPDAVGPKPTASCNACHEGSAADDFVFTQYYPVLRSAKGGGRGSHDGESCEECREELRQIGQVEGP